MVGGEAGRALNDFFGEMDAVIVRDVFATPEERAADLESAAIAAFDRIDALSKS